MLSLTANASAGEILLTAAEIAVMFGVPIFVIWLTKKVKFFNIIGAVALCYAIGFIFAILPIPYDKKLSETVASVLVALAIPLILFGFDILSVKKLAKKTVVSFSLVIASVVAVSCAASFIAASAGLENSAQLAGMTTGLYTGGTPNLIAIGNALLPSDVKSNTIAVANTSDFFVGGLYLLLVLTVMKPLYKYFLDGRKKSVANTEIPEQAGAEAEISACAAEKSDEDKNVEEGKVLSVQEEYNYKSIPRDKKSILKLAGVILLGAACLGIGAGLEILINGNMDGSLWIMITVSVLGIAFSFIKPVRSVKGSYQIGQYLVLVFSLGLSMSIDLSVLAQEMLPTLAFFACVQMGSLLLHLILCKIFRIDSGTALITSTAGVYGPPFIAPVANAFGDRKLILPGVICSTLGLMIGNLLGIGIGSLLALF